MSNVQDIPTASTFSLTHPPEIVMFRPTIETNLYRLTAVTVEKIRLEYGTIPAGHDIVRQVAAENFDRALELGRSALFQEFNIELRVTSLEKIGRVHTIDPNETA